MIVYLIGYCSVCVLTPVIQASLRNLISLQRVSGRLKYFMFGVPYTQHDVVHMVHSQSARTYLLYIGIDERSCTHHLVGVDEGPHLCLDGSLLGGEEEGEGVREMA